MAKLAVMHRHDQTADRPEQAIFEAADIPQPFAVRHFPDGGGRNQEVEKAERAGVERQNREYQSDGKKSFDDAGGVHLSRRRIELCGDEESERFRNEEFRVNMRDEKKSAD